MRSKITVVKSILLRIYYNRVVVTTALLRIYYGGARVTTQLLRMTEIEKLPEVAVGR